MLGSSYLPERRPRQRALGSARQRPPKEDDAGALNGTQFCLECKRTDLALSAEFAHCHTAAPVPTLRLWLTRMTTIRKHCARGGSIDGYSICTFNVRGPSTDRVFFSKGALIVDVTAKASASYLLFIPAK
jgi:hypothetical protein